MSRDIKKYFGLYYEDFWWLHHAAGSITSRSSEMYLKHFFKSMLILFCLIINLKSFQELLYEQYFHGGHAHIAYTYIK